MTSPLATEAPRARLPFSRSGSDARSRYCDYSGVQLSFVSGPNRWSIEGVDRLMEYQGHLLYHTPDNVLVTTGSLKWARYYYPLLTIAFHGAWRRAGGCARQGWAGESQGQPEVGPARISR